MRRARRLALALEGAIEAGEIDESTEACIERAFAAYELGSTDKQIATVAHLVQRAHEAIRDTRRSELESAYVDCAEVLLQGLPPHVQRQVSFDEVVDIVRELRREADHWAAIVGGTSRLLGWDEGARAHAVQAVRAAILSDKA